MKPHAILEKPFDIALFAEAVHDILPPLMSRARPPRAA